MSSADSRWTRYAVILLLLALPGVGCQRADNTAPSESTRTSEKEEAAGLIGSVQEPGVSPVYPVDSETPDPLAQRLCDALHTLPETRKAQCCETLPASTLAGECVRTLSTALRDKAVTLNSQDADRCVQETTQALAGCDWVTPLLLQLPHACHNIIQGQLPAGTRCRSSLECADGLFCQGSGPTTTGICAEPRAVGMTCTGSVDILGTYTRQVDYETHHLECAGFCQAGRCAPFVALAGACSPRSLGGTGLWPVRSRDGCTTKGNPIPDAESESLHIHKV